MKKSLQLSIPTPCHEDWAKMTPVEKGRFCDACQKKVHDFTTSPDKVILEAIAKDRQICGRFRIDQLNRKLVVQEKKSTTWAAAAVMSFLSLGSHLAIAQEPIPTEQHDIAGDTLGKSAVPQKILITGQVTDETGPLPGVSITIDGTATETTTDVDGNYTIEALQGDVIEFKYVGYDVVLIYIDSPVVNAYMEAITLSEVPIDTYGYLVQRRTFFGRIFHSIGNLFR